MLRRRVAVSGKFSARRFFLGGFMRKLSAEAILVDRMKQSVITKNWTTSGFEYAVQSIKSRGLLRICSDVTLNNVIAETEDYLQERA
jgi:hypothetical protein